MRSLTIKYQLVRRLAVGGMGEIFLARRGVGTDQFVILKALLAPADDDGAATRMFDEEARLMMLLHHPNIVRVFERFEDQGRHVIAMEYLDGESLAVLSRAASTKRRHEVAPFVEAIAQAAQGLHAAHVAVNAAGLPLNLVHRDISPQNIVATREGVAKLLDFGIAKALGNSVRTQTGLIKGKIAYMAPEQIAGQPLDARTDLYSLGVILWELALGRRAFAGMSELEMLTHVTTRSLPAPRSVEPTFDPVLDEIIAKAVTHDPARRFQNGELFAAALRGYLQQRHTGGAKMLGRYVETLVGAELERRRISEPTASSGLARDIVTAEVAAPTPGSALHARPTTSPTSTPREDRAAPPTKPLEPASTTKRLEMSSINLGGYAAALKSQRLYDVVHAAVVPETRAALDNPKSKSWFPQEVAIDLMSTIIRVSGRKQLADVNLRLCQDSMSKIALPLVQVALAISGRSPSVLLGRMESFVKIAQRGVEAKWVRGTPNKGTLTYTYVCAMPADVVEHGWRGVFRFGDELTGKITEVDRFEVASPKVFVFHLSWK